MTHKTQTMAGLFCSEVIILSEMLDCTICPEER